MKVRVSSKQAQYSGVQSRECTLRMEAHFPPEALDFGDPHMERRRDEPHLSCGLHTRAPEIDLLLFLRIMFFTMCMCCLQGPEAPSRLVFQGTYEQLTQGWELNSGLPHE